MFWLYERGAFCGGVGVRVIGLLFVLLAGPVFASEDRHGSGLARFAYADSVAFQTSFESVSPETPAPVASRARARNLPAPQPLTLVAAESIAELEIRHADRGPPERFPNSPAGAIEAVSLVPLADVLRSTPPEAQRLAALPEATQVPQADPPFEIIATEARLLVIDAGEVDASRRASLRKRSSGSRHASRKHARKTAAKANKIPRWASKMFDTPWQSRAFAYQ
jgi:hypothetical protein